MPDPTANDLTLTVLGCSGTFAGPGEACSGYLVRAGGVALGVDLGAGALANLQRHLPIDGLDALVLTHEHPDHWLDVPLLRNALRYVLGRPDRALPVYGTAGTRRLAATVIGDLAPTLDWRTVDASSSVEVGGLRVRFSLTDHPVETLAVRVDAGGRSLLYSADTGAGWAPGAVGEGVGTFVCEAALPPEEEGSFQHLSAAQAGALAAEIGAGRLVLTHLVPGADVESQRSLAAAAYGGPLSVAVTGADYRA
ncbi:MAG TPA: MBL fold metallo-hydrolase [Acidimicrobiales bacterium]|nr:MBL fold metallo-hydrolase [Acidimicrobiales bacterium]